MKEYINLAKAILVYSWKDFIVYRGYLLFWILVESGSFFVMYFLWMFIYKNHQLVSGFTLSAMITYYFVAYVIRQFTATYFDWNISIKINEGYFSQFLYRPLTHITYYIFHNIGEKSIRFIVSLPILGIMIFLIRNYFILPDKRVILLFGLSFLLSFSLLSVFTFIFGYTAFWTEKSETILYLKDSLVYYLSGSMVPLALFGNRISQILKLLPFRYFTSFPLEIYLGKLNYYEIRSGFTVGLIWLIILIILERIIYKKGARRFSAVGN